MNLFLALRLPAHRRRAFLVAAVVAAGPGLAAPAAYACGGCFHQPNENTVVLGHRMAVAVAMNRTVLWDQIQYAGNPSEFAWVLPVKAGASVELAHDAWFEVLDAATSEQAQSPQVSCGGGGFTRHGGGDSGFGCGSVAEDSLAAAGPETYGGYSGDSAVTIVHQGTVGPYETVTLQSSDPAALTRWLDDHGYELPADVAPIVAAYVKEQFDFIALRLIPGQGVQAMRPVRVIMPGGGATLPLRMVAAGTGASTAIKLFVLAEGRYQAHGFANDQIIPSQLVWDFSQQDSNYKQLRAQLLNDNGGRTWLASYARQGSLLTPYSDALGPVSYQLDGGAYASLNPNTIADAYVLQGWANGEVTEAADVNACTAALDAIGQGDANVNGVDAVVVADCDPADPRCQPAGKGQIAAARLKCAALDDLAVALTGMHPSDVWLTRLEAELPRAALDADLGLEPSPYQSTADNRFVAAQSVNGPCASVAARPRHRDRGWPGGLVASALALLAAAGLLRRRFDGHHAPAQM